VQESVRHDRLVARAKVIELVPRHHVAAGVLDADTGWVFHADPLVRYRAGV